jgi:fumarylpyruvate hydrolase
MEFVFDPAPQISAAVAGQQARFPVRRIYCVGRNYAAHIREMGFDPARTPPFFFMKPTDALVASGEAVPYPRDTRDFQYEIELVVAIGRGGSEIPVEKALDHVFGYAVGIDLTRRDRQLEMREAGRSWEIGKAFDASAPMAALHRATDVGHLDRGEIWLKVNGDARQRADIGQMIWSVAEVIAVLSKSWDLAPGDLIFTGTPDGIGPVVRGDTITGGIEGLTNIEVPIV